MMSTPDDWSSPQRLGLSRELALATGLICDGANAIGRADYANLSGYFSAFFGFSNGLERLAKIVCAVDAYIQTGEMPTDNQLRKYGHDLTRLVDQVEVICEAQGFTPTQGRPQGAISSAVLESFNMFADAKYGRYANFSMMNGSKSVSDSPVSLWWAEVCPLILLDHFYGTPQEARARNFTGLAGATLGSHFNVFHTDESGGALLSLEDAVWHGQLNRVTQRYGHFYSLQWARWLAACFREFSRHYHSIPMLAHQQEFLSTLLVDDQFLLNRINWPL